MKQKNATTLPMIFYGLHMAPGVAEYREDPENIYRILIEEPTLKKMDKTFQGKPLYVEHVDEVDLPNLEQTADGYVVESFYNKADGKHWAKFIVITDEAKQRIKEGWRLSNAYLLTETKDYEGQWHSVDYHREVVNGEYEHLAIVANPRYEESIILTPEEFKEYNESKEAELLKLANSKETKTQGEKGMLKFFKREAVENSKDLENHVVVLPKSKKEISITQLVNEMDEIEEKKDDPRKVQMSDMIEMNEGEEITVEEFMNKYNAMCEENAKMKSEMDEYKKNEDEEKDKEENEDDEDDKKEENEDHQKEENEEDDDDEEENEDDDKSKNSKDDANFQALKNAQDAFDQEIDDAPLELGFDMAARGRQRYGSGK